jgi:hypothetical protein
MLCVHQPVMSQPNRQEDQDLPKFTSTFVMPCHARVMWCRAVSCRVMPCHVVSGRVMSCQAVSCRVRPCHAVSCRVRPCHVVSGRVMSCHVVSCRVMSCQAVSCRVVVYLMHLIKDSLLNNQRRSTIGCKSLDVSHWLRDRESSAPASANISELQSIIRRFAISGSSGASPLGG